MTQPFFIKNEGAKCGKTGSKSKHKEQANRVAAGDEIDSGVSGEIAEKVGFFMKEISEKQQIIAITHLPQIASIANDHYKVFKNEFESEKTETKIHLLDRKKRVIELARLLSGEEITNEAIANAEKMLNI